MPRQSKITKETIQKASKFCATNGFMLQNNHQARKITLIQIEIYIYISGDFFGSGAD